MTTFKQDLIVLRADEKNHEGRQIREKTSGESKEKKEAGHLCPK